MMSRMYPQPPSTSAYASDGQQRVRSAPADLPYYLAAPSYGDYHGSASSVPSSLATSAVPSDYQLGEMMARDHYAMRNYTGPDSSAADYAPGSHLAGFDYMDNPMTSSRSRWSWPWTDVSSFAGSGQGGLGGGENSLSTAATFKKHHHHHYHPKHKELHHHELGQHEEHMVMPKWEHGITVGEIVCVALAVVLGIVILGSPFFLLFLMLFNGGNLFGATQMGLLAPAAVSAAAAQGTGRRRRRRSVGSANDVDPHPSTTGKLKMRTSDLVRAGEYLFERLSPFMDADKLMRSFQRIMDVKDDIERIIGKIADEPKYSAGHREEAKTAAGQHVEPAASHQHVEMRRRK